ncbi:DUF4235 domain-containing protein [Prauserella muralis]|uniref:Uncharacterized protein n=1 Tax=Prauserella muralis TaxID=588067 RepID=A0A2V4AZN5_9PSEU|nr:DUF4235 domain-containing protein [Prauserella muralis]PXY27332.1 hypothetical protein BAY60_12875 [Prauserella muralis]TWE22986.1 uncharacterized protein DUF4235 [Prauserella muralis]
MKAIYKPLSLVVSTAGAMLSSVVFKQVWRRVTGEQDAPDATDRKYALWQVVTAAAVQGAIFGAVKAAVDRAGAAGIEKATGDWPGDE